jgi:rsbT co-antagonist protein RsbR
VYQQRFAEVSVRATEDLEAVAEFAPILAQVSPGERAAQEQATMSLVTAAVESGSWQEYVAHLAEQGRTYGALGLSFGAWYQAVGSVRHVLLPYLLEAYPDPRQHRDAVLGMDRFMDAAMATIGNAYLVAKESTIRAQQEAIRELSTPVLPVRDGLLVLPVVGVVDSHRAYQLTHELLESIRRTRAKVVVIDITGVPSVDSRVANHLMQTVDAAKLMGTDAIMTGLSPSIAKALVTLGVDLGRLRTVGDLQGGLALAEELLGYTVDRARVTR